MDSDYRIDGEAGVGGNCMECGDTLCAPCAGEWSEDGRCKMCVDWETLNETAGA